MELTIHHKKNDVLSIYAMTFSMWTMLLSMFDKASKILNHNGERADASNLALFFMCSLFRERNFKNHIGPVSVTRVHFVLKHGSRLKFFGEGSLK